MMLTKELLSKLPAMEQEADDLERRAEALRHIIAGVRTLNGDLGTLFGEASHTHTGNGGNGSDVMEDGPRGREAVTLIMSERQGNWTMAQIKREVHRRRWPSSPKAIETAVHRLHHDGVIEWVRKGVYRLAQAEEVAT